MSKRIQDLCQAAKSNQTLCAGLLAAATVTLSVGTAHATTINVTTAGAPVAGKCSLTQAIQAAVTNAAVGACPAGSSASTDTVQLAANTIYQNYGKPLVVPSTGGALIIRGALSNGEPSSEIFGKNYGYPSPNPINPQVCPYPATLFSGGSNLTLRDLILNADSTDHTGICQYSGSLTLNKVQVAFFQRGGIVSSPNTPGNSRSLTIIDSIIEQNANITTGGGIALYEEMTVSIRGSSVSQNVSNESGGGLSWQATGSLTIRDTYFWYNDAQYSVGGGIYLNPYSSGTSVSLNGVDMQQNTADYNGGAIWVGTLGANKLSIGKSSVTQAITRILNNFGTLGDQVPYNAGQAVFNADPNFAYDAIWCTGGSEIHGLNVAPWNSRTPRLRGDGTCSFQ